MPDPSDSPQRRLEIDGVPLDDVESKVLESLLLLAGQGSVPAATAALAHVQRQREARRGEEHRLTLASLATDPPALCRYLGTVAATPDEVAAHVGHAMTAPERAAYDAGQSERIVEARAVELAAMRSGAGKAPKWAGSRYR